MLKYHTLFVFNTYMDFSKLNLEDNQKLARLIVKGAVTQNFKRRTDFEKFRNKMTKENKAKIFHNLYFIKAYNDLVKEGEISPNENFLSLIKKRSVRTLSGVSPITVMMKPYPCPGRCVYCPTDVRMPKSYLPSQPAAQRAFRQRFNPYTQVFVRLKALTLTGHPISKAELRIIGGTFSAYTKIYQKWFIKQCLLAMNEFDEQCELTKDLKMSDLTEEIDVKSVYGIDKVNAFIMKALNGDKKFDEVIKENEIARVRCIGINIETRPDFVTKKEVKYLRHLGVTKVEMGVQTVYDKIFKITGRGHTVKDVKNATLFLKDAGMKVAYHIMPCLPDSSAKMDEEMFDILFKDSSFQPDYLKIYPCVVMEKSVLYKWFKDGKYKPYSEKILHDVLYHALKVIPSYCRIDRIARDIPANEVKHGLKASNIRQILEDKAKKEDLKIKDIRFREIKNEQIILENIDLKIYEYEASKSKEMFLSYEDIKKDKIIALLRLRFPYKVFIKELDDCALIREVHVYGKQIAVGDSGNKEKQHLGFGKKLLISAAKISKKAGYKKIAVIAGIGTREYYKKFGYRLVGDYMIKNLI